MNKALMDADRSSSPWLAALRVALEGKGGEAPVTIVFANSSYAELLDNWLRHALPFLENNLIVFSLDEALHARMQAQGLSSVYLPHGGELDALWRLRLQLFWLLSSLGVSFVSSDADAVWLRDPRAYCSQLDCDLVISAGTVWPPEVVEQWGFALCCGMFFVRASPRMTEFLQAVRLAATKDADDQAALNRVLMKAGVDWQTSNSSWDVHSVEGRSFRCFKKVVVGETPANSRFDIRIALLPQTDVQRIPLDAEAPFVKHPLAPKEPHAKISALRDNGCWRETPLHPAKIHR